MASKIGAELPGEITGNARLKSSLGKLHRGIDPSCVTRAADNGIILREQACQPINRTLHQIADDDFDTKVADFRDVALLGWHIGLDGAGTQQYADFCSIDPLGATGQVAQDGHAEFSRAKHENVPRLHIGNCCGHLFWSFTNPVLPLFGKAEARRKEGTRVILLRRRLLRIPGSLYSLGRVRKNPCVLG
jgi:hypothetical protein